MINGEKVLAVITARSGSKGLPGKNIRDFAGEPLLARPITIAVDCEWVDKTVLSTDSEEYAQIGKKFGAEVPRLRPQELALDTAQSVDVILEMVSFLESRGEHYGYILLLEPTSPLTQVSDLNGAKRTLLEDDSAESILAVKEVTTEHPVFCVELSKQKRLSPYMKNNFNEPVRRQDLSSLYCFSGSFYLSTVSALRQHRKFYHESALGYVMPAWKCREIDDLADFICAEALYKNRELFRIKSVSEDE